MCWGCVASYQPHNLYRWAVPVPCGLCKSKLWCVSLHLPMYFSIWSEEKCDTHPEIYTAVYLPHCQCKSLFSKICAIKMEKRRITRPNTQVYTACILFPNYKCPISTTKFDLNSLKYQSTIKISHFGQLCAMTKGLIACKLYKKWFKSWFTSLALCTCRNIMEAHKDRLPTGFHYQFHIPSK